MRNYRKQFFYSVNIYCSFNMVMGVEVYFFKMQIKKSIILRFMSLLISHCQNFMRKYMQSSFSIFFFYRQYTFLIHNFFDKLMDFRIERFFQNAMLKFKNCTCRNFNLSRYLFLKILKFLKIRKQIIFKKRKISYLTDINYQVCSFKYFFLYFIYIILYILTQT